MVLFTILFNLAIESEPQFSIINLKPKNFFINHKMCVRCARTCACMCVYASTGVNYTLYATKKWKQKKCSTLSV